MSRRTLPIPIPGAQLRRMQEDLAPTYGSELWEGEGHRILVIRTPGEHPDVVNDLERAVEHLEPGDVKDLDNCLLLGERRSTAVSVGPLQELMQQRLQRDKEAAAHLRNQIPDRTGHVLHREQLGGQRTIRLGIRIPAPRARDIDDEHLELLADELGPLLDTPNFRAVRAVHLLADEDSVRIDADVLLPELRRRYQDEDRHRKAEAQEAARRAAEEERRKAERAQITSVLRQRYGDDTPTRIPGQDAISTGGTSHVSTIRPASDRARIDAITGRSSSMQIPPTPAGRGEARTPPMTTARGLVRSTLEAVGYEVMDDPEVPGHRIDVAAERDDPHPRRIIVRIAQRLDVALAEDVLRTCRQITPDAALIVADEADTEASEMLIATKAKWVAPDDLADLRM